MTTQTKSFTARPLVRTGLAVLIITLAFFASYRVAGALGGGSRSTVGTAGPRGAAFTPATDKGSLACACCGGAAADQKPIEGAATLEGDVQRITVDTSAGYYNPNTITLTAGVPAEITFTEASGCLAEVQSADLDFYADLTNGGATVRIEADTLAPGTYSFSCGMQMVFGTIVVK